MSEFTCNDCRHWESDDTSDGVCNAHNMLFWNGTPFCQYFETKDGSRPRFCRLASSVDEMADALATITVANVEVALAAVKKQTEFSDDEKKKMMDEMKSWLMEVEKMTITETVSPEIQRILSDELRLAKEKHPEFSTAFAPSVIMEELGELAQLYNDYGDGKIALNEFRNSSTVECAHVAVTAIRLLENLTKGETK